MPTRSRTATVPILPLPRGTVLLPGITQQIVVSSDRPDLSALLSSVYARAATQQHRGRIDAVSIACVPLASPLLGPRGHLLLTVSGHAGSEPPEFNADKMRKSDLFGCGVAARIVGMQRQGGDSGDFSILVEGLARVHVDKISQERPCFEGKVTWYHDESKSF